MNRFWAKQQITGPPGAESRRNFTATPVKNLSAWDSIIVGTSPLLLLEAIYLARTGREVLVVEENEQLGGAWGLLPSEADFPYLDVGCHYFDISRRAYDFLRSGVGLDMVPFRPQPQFVYRNFQIPYDYRQINRVFRHLRVAVRQRSIGRFLSNIFRDENFRLRMYPFTRTFMFPSGGSRELVSRLVILARDADVTILKPLHVHSIRFDRERDRVEVGAGDETFEARQIVAGSQARISDALRVTPRPEDTHRCSFTHVNLVFRDRSEPTFSYIRFLRHPAVIRMTDVTNPLRHWRNGLDSYRVICIGIRDTYDQSLDDSDKVEDLVELLKRHCLIDPSARCEMSCWSRYPVEFLSETTRNKLQAEFAPMIRLIPTINFSLGLVNNLDRWETAFDSTCVLGEAPRSIYP